MAAEKRIAEPVKELTHKIKVIQFLGRTTPIILQDDNGSCPLLAICNVLLLKNNLNLSPDMPEVSQEKLLSLVMERLMDSNSNVNNKDAAYVENQQQNISDAIDLLLWLTTGINVNIKFKEVSDFEFTRERAIFDLLDIPLYHGWIVDPQDSDTYNAIDSKSYNTIMGELVALETGIMGNEYTKEPEEESDDIVAATTATLGVPSPSLSRGLSFADSTGSSFGLQKVRKGDREEEEELLRALTLSKDNVADSSVDQNTSVGANESATLEKSDPVVPTEIKEGNTGDEIQKSSQHEPSISNDSNDVRKNILDLITFDEIPEKDDCLSSKKDQKINDSQISCEKSGELNIKNDVGEKTSNGLLDFREAAVPDSREAYPLCTSASSTDHSGGAKLVQDQSMLKLNVQEAEDDQSDDKKSKIACKNELSPEQGELIKDFLETNANQLTIFGLFRLQEKLKDREICVFFCNNHFNTMFKYEGQLYLLATDQGYINQPDLVWERLNEVNGNTEFVTGLLRNSRQKIIQVTPGMNNILELLLLSILPVLIIQRRIYPVSILICNCR